MRIPRPFATLACLFAALPAQQVALPNGTGHLTPPAGWTALGPTELGAASRPSDPQAAPADALLAGVIADIGQRGRTAEHVLLHAPGGAAGQLRLVNCYSADGRATTAELLSERAVTQMRDALQQALAATGGAVEYLGHERCALFPIGGLVMHFAQTVAEHRFRLDYYVTAAGERLQYFEASYAAEDPGADAAIAALLRTFDGAREAPDKTIGNMLVGGLAGAVAGIAAALLRRRRLQRQAAGSPPEAG